MYENVRVIDVEISKRSKNERMNVVGKLMQIYKNLN